MVKTDVSFILSFVILMAKMWIFGFSPRVCPMEPSNLVFSHECLVSNGRRALLEGIRLGGSTTLDCGPTTASPFGRGSDQISWLEVPVGDQIMVSAYHSVSGPAQMRAVATLPAGPNITGKRVHWRPRVYEPDT